MKTLPLLIALVAVLSLACTTDTKVVYMQATPSPTPGNTAQQASLTSTVAAPSPAACPTLAACPTSTACPADIACPACPEVAACPQCPTCPTCPEPVVCPAPITCPQDTPCPVTTAVTMPQECAEALQAAMQYEQAIYCNPYEIEHDICRPHTYEKEMLAQLEAFLNAYCR